MIRASRPVTRDTSDGIPLTPISVSAIFYPNDESIGARIFHQGNEIGCLGSLRPVTCREGQATKLGGQLIALGKVNTTKRSAPKINLVGYAFVTYASPVRPGLANCLSGPPLRVLQACRSVRNGIAKEKRLVVSRFFGFVYALGALVERA